MANSAGDVPTRSAGHGALTTNFVGCDDVMVGELATRHVVEIGRTPIAHIGGTGTSPSVDRLKGHRNALAAADLQMPKNYIVTVEHFEDAGDSTGYQEMKELLGLKVRPDAVFCYNDLSAIGAMQAAGRRLSYSRVHRLCRLREPALHLLSEDPAHFD
jgi:DNA-binding LacI/PurR family transcriptional regulator